jgi:toluene monooxygenase system protein E
MTARRTYWHLEGRGRVPQSYDIKTSQLLYYPERGFEVSTPAGAWMLEHGAGSALRARFADFRDPAELTFSRYVERRAEQEAFLDQLLSTAEETAYDARLSPSWLGVLDTVLPVLRYPTQALHMLAAYVAHLAPEGRVVVAGAFQASDELRRLERVCQRMRQLQAHAPSFGEGSRSYWQEHAAWQPLREVLERLLVTYDFGEALIALNLVVKPAFDELFMREWGEVGRVHGDHLLTEVTRSLYRDCRWQRQYTRALLTSALSEQSDNRVPIQLWLGRWWPRMQAALLALVGIWGLSPAAAEACVTRVREVCEGEWLSLGLQVP